MVECTDMSLYEIRQQTSNNEHWACYVNEYVREKTMPFSKKTDAKKKKKWANDGMKRIRTILCIAVCRLIVCKQRTNNKQMFFFLFGDGCCCYCYSFSPAIEVFTVEIFSFFRTKSKLNTFTFPKIYYWHHVNETDRHRLSRISICLPMQTHSHTFSIHWASVNVWVDFQFTCALIPHNSSFLFLYHRRHWRRSQIRFFFGC